MIKPDFNINTWKKLFHKIESKYLKYNYLKIFTKINYKSHGRIRVIW